MASSSQPKFKCLTIDDKLKMIRELESETDHNFVKTAEKYNVSRSTVSRLWHTKEEFTKKHDGLQMSNRKRKKAFMEEDVDNALYLWLQHIKQHLQMNALQLKAKAEQLAREMGHSFIPSDGWIQRFKMRHNLRFNKYKDKRQSTDNESTADEPCMKYEVYIDRDITEQQGSQGTPAQLTTGLVKTMSLPHHPPLKHRRTTLERAEKFISEHYFTDVNLQSRLYGDTEQATGLSHYPAPDRIPYQEAVTAEYTPVSVGKSFGPIWSTHWFKVDILIPESWLGKEVHFMWNSGCEALVWMDGEPRQGLNEMKEKHHYILSRSVDRQCLSFQLYIEMACNTLFGVHRIASENKDVESRTFTLQRAEIAVFNRDVYELIHDIESLHDIAKEFGDDQRGYQALYAVNDIMNLLSTRDDTKWPECREIAKRFFNQKNGDSQHTLYAMGHAHIDTAWLWPYAETIRKCARSWSCSIRLMEKNPHFKFCCSQAQQFDWVKSHYPSLWQDICKFVAKGQFIPVGGTWVEMDGNIPSGEACIRQFLCGQGFFQKEFGIQCKEFWLPDTFGYSAQFPQILRHCGVSRFLTQKISWSLVNKFPHHTFQWEGIDGSTVLTHFPPGDSYEMKGTVSELRKSVTNFRDKGRSNRSAFLFGHGDGGHGPSEEMLDRLQRFKDCDGLPRIKMSGPDEFFSSIENEELHMLCRWRGELYLELHNGTYTTWGMVKKGNRQCEILLQEVEAMSTMACLKDPAFEYPHHHLDRLWKLLLLNQFHDVLPGSSITQVFKDATEYYDDIRTSGSKLLDAAVDAIIKIGAKDMTTQGTHIINAQGFERTEVVTVPMMGSDKCSSSPAKRSKIEGRGDESHQMMIAKVEIPAFCVRSLQDCAVDEKVEPLLPIEKQGNNYVLSNDKIRAVIDPLGRVISLVLFNPECPGLELPKEFVDQNLPANQFVLYDDIPLYWDAWDVMDYHLETRTPVLECQNMVEMKGSTRKTLTFTLKVGKSSIINQEIILDAGSPYLRFNTTVSWHESHKMLKVEFPTSIHSMSVSYDIQSGFYQRPNHFNTSWDSARFEVCGHKWADISEHGFGVAILNDCKYGYSAVDGTIRLSLLRSPKSPDPLADMGVHTFSYAMMPHVGSLQESGVIQESVAFNSPLRIGHGISVTGMELPSLFTSSTPQILIQTVKMAEDRSGDVIVRLNEAFGGSVKGYIISSMKFSNCFSCNGLEDLIEDRGDILSYFDKAQICVNLKPFQIVSLRCKI